MPSPRIPPADWTDPRHRLGWEAEVVAGKWLEARGWTVLEHRWRLGRNDLDLIARRAGIVAFIEVKVRRTDNCGAGEEAVGMRKRRAIERAAWAWILRHGGPSERYRFDVMALSGPGPGALTLRHIEDAWRPGWR
ncbi:MAG: YraN family protein [Gemmatimonadales bacterium]